MASHISPSFLTVPAEIHAAIISHLECPDLHILRLTNSYFFHLIPPPTHKDLLVIEMLDSTQKLDLFACRGCTRLRPAASFSPKMVRKEMKRGRFAASRRFCIECGRRPLPGVHRYTPGSRWEENGVPFVRCLGCSEDAQAPKDRSITRCLSCHTRNLEIESAAKELERVEREEKQRLARSKWRADRREKWIKDGFALSDYREVLSEDDDFDWGIGK